MYVMLDAGGTNIKSGIIDESGQLLGTISEHPSMSSADKDTIFRNIASVIAMEAEKAERCDGIGFAFPGPFDYEKGISLMQGIGKYDSIYGIPVMEGLSGLLDSKLSSARTVFLHDVAAFAEGYASTVSGKTGKIMFVVIGTGAGSAFVVNGRCSADQTLGIPADGWIYNYPFKDSIIDDYISARGQSELAVRNFGHDVAGRLLDELATSGDGRALSLFDEFGANLEAAVRPFVDSFKPDMLVFAGQISKSFRFFSKQISALCLDRNIKIHIELDTSLRVFQGLFQAMKRGGQQNV